MRCFLRVSIPLRCRTKGRRSRPRQPFWSQLTPGRERRPIFNPSNPSIVNHPGGGCAGAAGRGGYRRARPHRRNARHPDDARTRDARLAELDSEILSLQRRKECVIPAIAAAETFVPRRQCADPRAVLMIVLPPAEGKPATKTSAATSPLMLRPAVYPRASLPSVDCAAARFFASLLLRRFGDFAAANFAG